MKKPDFCFESGNAADLAGQLRRVVLDDGLPESPGAKWGDLGC